jgi:membrane protein YdbS with pleckstrin-like domain
MWAAGSLLGDLLLLAGLLVVRWFDWFDLPWWLWVLYGGGVVVGVVVTPLVRYRVHRWESTESAVYTQSGWLTLERRIAPMSRVQTVDVERGAIARLLGLATVTVTTASAAGPVRIEGIESATADRLVAELARRTADGAGDAT